MKLSPETYFSVSHEINKILIETTLPNIADRWKELRIPIFKNKDKMIEVSQYIESAIAGSNKISSTRTQFFIF